MEVPVIDLAGQDEEQTALQLRQACSHVGFFYVTGHGVPQELLDEVFRLNRALFQLPLADKQALLADANNRGWTPFKEETLDPANQSTGDTKEGFYFGREVLPGDPDHGLPLHGPNQWPDEVQHPTVQGYRRAMEDYLAACRSLGDKLLRVLALSLGLPAEHFDPFFTQPMAFLRPLYYHAIVSQPGDGVFGAGAHSDYGMLTFLATDHVPGLQIHHGGKWHDVPPKEGCFIVNLGDMLERWTNGLYLSTLHRVVNTTGQERYSIACFFEPNFTSQVECLPQCCGPDRPPKYPPTTSGQHILDKYASTHAGYTGATKIESASS